MGRSKRPSISVVCFVLIDAWLRLFGIHSLRTSSLSKNDVIVAARWRGFDSRFRSATLSLNSISTQNQTWVSAIMSNIKDQKARSTFLAKRDPTVSYR
jgi:hypothetical protein